MQARHEREMLAEWESWSPLYTEDIQRIVNMMKYRMKATHNSMSVCGIGRAEREQWMIERLCEIVNLVVREG